MLYVLSIAVAVSVSGAPAPVEVGSMFGPPVAFVSKAECDALAARVAAEQKERVACAPLKIESGGKAEAF
jgi:hypothetical protein